MASISSLTNSSSASSIYGNRNILSGVASGLDTESMIENSIQGYKTRIQKLQNQQTKITWKQDAYRSITDKMIALKETYTSYGSKTNLASVGFFSKAVTTTTGGKYADKISATGKTSSDVKINAVKQLATAARYTVSADRFGTSEAAATGSAMNLTDNIDVSTISGSMTLKVGTKSISLDFGGTEVYKTTEDLAQAINDKLKEQNITSKKDGTVSGDKMIVASVDKNDPSKIVFTAGDAAENGDSVWISSVSGNLKKTLNITAGELGKGDTSITVKDESKLFETKSAAEYMKDKYINVTLDGVTKKVSLGDLTVGDGENIQDKLLDNLQKGLKDAFGSKVSVDIKDGALSFSTTSQNSTLKVTSSVGEVLGLGDSGVTNYLDTSTKLKDIKFSSTSKLEEMKPITVDAGEVTEKDGAYYDKAGNALKKVGEGENATYVRVDKDGNTIYTLAEGVKPITVDAGEVTEKDGAYYDKAGNALKKVVMDGQEIYARVDKDGKPLYSLLEGMKPITVAADEVTTEKDGTMHDKAGNAVDKQPDGTYVRVDKAGKPLYSLEINGKQVGAFSEDTTLESLITTINGSDAGVKVNFSRMTNKFTFTATETGSDGQINFGARDSLAFRMFGSTATGKETLNDGTVQDTGVLADSSGKPIAMTETVDGVESTYYIKYDRGNYIKVDKPNGQASGGRPIKLPEDSEAVQAALAKTGLANYTAGTDAILSATVNGEEITLTRSSNIVDIDGLSVNLKGTFNDKDADGNSNFVETDGKITFNGEIEADGQVTFTTKANADDLVKTISEFVEQYNDILKSAHDAYSTAPANLGKSSYEPLTDAEKDDLSESEIKAYEEKAKQGILFGNSDINRAYSSLRRAIAVTGDDRKAMEAIGLTTSYKDGVTTLSLDETKLRAALDTNPDAVQKVFTETKDTGGSTDGLMARVKKTMDTYASTSIGAYGVLVKAAGTRTSSLTLMSNTLQKQIDGIDKEIDRWQTKMSDKIDYYTRQFTALEQLMAQFNSQSSTLAGMMGG